MPARRATTPSPARRRPSPPTWPRPPPAPLRRERAEAAGDRHIWGAYLADQGWRPYEGVSPHTDHIHISFSWAGALGQTSFWTGQVANVGPVSLVAGAAPPHVDVPGALGALLAARAGVST